MKIFISQQNYHIGNFEKNGQKIKQAIHQAIHEGGDLIVFSELAVCGYPPRDFLEFDEFTDKCYELIADLAPLSTSIGILVGAPAPNPMPEGKNLFNSAYYLYEGKVQQVIHKALLPNYDVFDEYRYFEPGTSFQCIEHQGTKIAVTICEDIWDLEEDPLYTLRPMDVLVHEQPAFMINLSASPFDYTHAADRKIVVHNNATHYKIPVVYCNTVGSQTEIVFDGGSLVYNADGNIVAELPYFAEALASVTWDGHKFTSTDQVSDAVIPSVLDDATYQPTHNIAAIHAALVYGIQEYFHKMNFSKAVVSSSGGIDSAVVLALACEALGPANVHALLQPSQYSSDHSVDDAVQLSINLGNPYDITPIQPIYAQVTTALSPIFQGAAEDVTEENIQSRIRGLMVMALANKYNYILLNTSNKSELATGYGTLYGDMAGGLGILGDVYKTQVYELAAYINKDKEIIPSNILTKAPSAELRPDQKDSDSLPDYSLLDAVLYQYIERRQGLQDIIQMGFPAEDVTRILKMMNRNEYKRSQFCPIIRVSPKAFGIGRRIPIVAKYEL